MNARRGNVVSCGGLYNSYQVSMDGNVVCTGGQYDGYPAMRFVEANIKGASNITQPPAYFIASK